MKAPADPRLYSRRVQFSVRNAVFAEYDHYAALLKMDTSAFVRGLLLELLKNPEALYRAAEPVREMRTRKRAPKRRWTPEEEEILQELRSRGRTTYFIAHRLRRNYNSVHRKIAHAQIPLGGGR